MAGDRVHDNNGAGRGNEEKWGGALRVIVGGDVHVPYGSLEVAREPWEDLFGDARAEFSQASLTIVNLEGPVCGGGSPIAKTGPVMCSDSKIALRLKAAGVGLVTLANNHIMDLGEVGLHRTIQALDEAGIAHVGAGVDYAQASAPYVYRDDACKVAVLSFAENEWSTTAGSNPGANPIDPVRNFSVIAEARKRADHVLVITHGGHEMYELPSPRMKELFRFYVDAGASAVINHHQHCISGYEVYRGSPIFYGIGNLFFPKEHVREGPWCRGILVELKLEHSREVGFQLHHFDQSRKGPGVKVCSPEIAETRIKKLSELNSVIADDLLLQERFDQFAAKMAGRYLLAFEPFSNRMLQSLYVRGLFPGFLKARKKRLMLNIIRCEAHRDLALWAFKYANRDS